MGSEGSTNSSGHSLIDMYSKVKFRTLDGRVCGSGRDNSTVKNVKPTNVQGKKTMANDDVNSKGKRNKKECLDSIGKRKELFLGGNNTFSSRSTKMARLTTPTKQQAVISPRNIKGNRERKDGQANLNDEGTALKMLDSSKQGRLTFLGYGHEVGDMVWGRVESHPWWPGQIFDEAFACPSVRNTKKKGHLLVAFYGDNSYGWFKPDELIPFDTHFTEKSKQSNTPGFLTAVGEAKDEVNRRAALGMTCCCRNPNHFRATRVQAFVKVDVSDFENGCVYPVKQIERARDGFQPIKTLVFLKKLALMPRNDMQRNIGCMKNVARLLAYRRAEFEEFDETYAQAFRVERLRPGGSLAVLNDSLEVPPQAPLRVQGDEKSAGPTEPTMLVMKFPYQSRLPSVSEVKAKFARFGKIDEFGTRVFWKSSTCQVVFKNVASAEAAYNHALQGKAIFSNMKVKYSLRASKVSFPDGAGESSKLVAEESPNVIPELKSCLKKSPDDKNVSVDSITRADHAINNKYCQVEVRKNKSNQSTSSTTNDVDISQPMLILLMKCSEIVANLMNSSA